MTTQSRYNRGEMGRNLVQALDDLLGIATSTEGYAGDQTVAEQMLAHPGGDSEVRIAVEGGRLWEVWPEATYYTGDWGGSNENMVWPVESGGVTAYLVGDTEHNGFHLLTEEQAEAFLARTEEIVEATPPDEEGEYIE